MVRSEPGEWYVRIVIFVFLLACLGWGITIKEKREIEARTPPNCMVNGPGIQVCEPAPPRTIELLPPR